MLCHCIHSVGARSHRKLHARTNARTHACITSIDQNISIRISRAFIVADKTNGYSPKTKS